MGLRLKLGLYVVGFVAAVLTVAGLITSVTETRIYREQAERRSITLLKSFAIPCAIAMANNDIAILDNYIEKFASEAKDLELTYMAVIDYEARRVVAHTTPSEFGRVYDDPFTLRAAASPLPVWRHVLGSGGEPMLEVAVPLESGLRWGTLRAGFSLTSIELAVVQSRIRLLYTGLAVLLAAALVAYLVLSVMVLRPVQRLSQMALRFGAGDLSARVHLTQTDEMGQLSSRLNGMAQQIQEYTESLEGLVQARTRELETTNEQLVGANEQLERLARTDSLTGLFNRRHFMEQLHFEIRRGTRTRHQFALILMDVDHFKHYNDTNGHPAGDDLLHKLAQLLQASLRATDLVARYGGEEFVVLLLDTGPEEGLATARKLQQAVESYAFPHAASQPLGKVTISVGIAFYPIDSVDGRTLIDDADQALYRSKQGGRNRVTRWSEMGTGGQPSAPAPAP